MTSLVSKPRGFTLIELLVVIAIIGILTAIILPDLSGSKVKARDAQRVSDISQIQLILEQYFDRCGQYPSTLSVTASNGCPTTTPATNLGTYITQIPVQPGGAAYDYATLSLTAGGGPLINYVLHVHLESSNAAVAKSLNAMPTVANYSWTATTGTSVPYTCSNASNSLDYCATSN